MRSPTLALVLLSLAAGPALAAPYRLDALHDRENRIQDRVDQGRLGPGAGRALTRVRDMEERMRASHGSNLTRRDFAILNARLHAIEDPGSPPAAVRRAARARAGGAAGAGTGARARAARPATAKVTTTTTTTVTKVESRR